MRLSILSDMQGLPLFISIFFCDFVILCSIFDKSASLDHLGANFDKTQNYFVFCILEQKFIKNARHFRANFVKNKRPNNCKRQEKTNHFA